MQRRLGTDLGLTARMFLTLFLLALVYLLFIAVLWRLGISLAFLILVAVVLLGAQSYFSDKLIPLSLGSLEVSEQEPPQLHEIWNRLPQMTRTLTPNVPMTAAPARRTL